MAGENLDLSTGESPDARRPGPGTSRRFLGIQFACCNIYARIYVNQAETAY